MGGGCQDLRPRAWKGWVLQPSLEGQVANAKMLSVWTEQDDQTRDRGQGQQATRESRR